MNNRMEQNTVKRVIVNGLDTPIKTQRFYGLIKSKTKSADTYLRREWLK